MRNAWNVRVAGWISPGRERTTADNDVGERGGGADRRSDARLDDGAGDGARMALFAENENDVGKIALACSGDHIGRARTLPAHAHVERPVEAEGKAARGGIELHGGDAEVEHHAVHAIGAAIARDCVEIGKAVFDQREPAVRRLHQVGAERDRALVAVDADHFAVGGRENGAAIAAGAESGVDIDAAVMHVEEVERRRAEHGNMVGRSANDSRKAVAARRHSRTPGVLRAADWAPSWLLSARTLSVASASSFENRPGSQS